MEQIRDDYIISCIERTGFPPWMQEMIEDYESDIPAEEEEELSEVESQILDQIQGAVLALDMMNKTEKGGQDGPGEGSVPGDDGGA